MAALREPQLDMPCLASVVLANFTLGWLKQSHRTRPARESLALQPQGDGGLGEVPGVLQAILEDESAGLREVLVLVPNRPILTF